MIVRSYPHRNLYGSYFLATEAPDDERVTEENKPRRNVKVVSVKPNNRRRTDFSSVGNDDTPQEEDMPIEADAPDTGDEPETDDGNDYTQDEPESNNVPLDDENDDTLQEEPPQEDTDNQQPTEPTDVDEELATNEVDDFSDNYDDAVGNEDTEADDAPDSGNDTPTVNDGGEDATADEGDPDAPDTGESEDFSGEDDGVDDTEGEASTDAGMSEGEENKPGTEYDSTRKYMLYLEFMSLHNSCENFISKLESISRDNIQENRVIQISANNLREIRDLLYDYMVIKFSSNSYVQSLLFYQKMIVAVQLIFRQIKIIKQEVSKKKKQRNRL